MLIKVTCYLETGRLALCHAFIPPFNTLTFAKPSLSIAFAVPRA
ncbi:hypothetical protein MGSAQ_001076 [marine sediment metagenome]|uniref:Uncharacterized protein n=1 Tax=marine sediment metagenome TaxID=412755 RepID=A0A1B6NVN7_9ZZZZ